MAAPFNSSIIQLAFFCFTSEFSRTVGGFTITLAAYPVLTQDRAGLVKDLKVAFSVTDTDTLAATVHLHNTNCSLHVQGSSPISPKPGADTVAEWLTEAFIIPRIQQHMDSSKTDAAKLAAINTAVLNLPSKPNSAPTTGSSLYSSLTASPPAATVAAVGGAGLIIDA